MANTVRDKLQGLFPTVASADVQDVGRRTITVMCHGAAAAADVAETPVWVATNTCVIEAVYWVPLGALGKAAANYITISLHKRDSADYTTADLVAAISTEDVAAGVALVAFTPQALTITAANAELNALDTVTMSIVDAAGTAAQAGAMVIRVRDKDAP